MDGAARDGGRPTSSEQDFTALAATIARLRGPEGCPWDRAQTLRSMRASLLEECYEVLEAIDSNDTKRLSTELGDLLMQVVFQAQLATEAGDFTLSDVIRGINDKLVRRHPHVFGNTRVCGTEEVLQNWEAIKKEERPAGQSMLSGLPQALPALAMSQEIQDRVARVGFDWPEDSGVLDKLTEEVGELKSACSVEEKEAEFGDVLFTLANIARRQGIELEPALRETNRRFSQRFAYMEKLCRERGLELVKLSLDELNALWDEAKKAEG